MSRRFCNDNSIDDDCAHLLPSAIVCLCGDRFDSDWTNDNNNAGALWLYLAHKASALASLSTIVKPHHIVCTLVSCVLCTQSIDVEHYRAHLAQCRRDGERLAADKYRRLSTQFVSPLFYCTACIDDDRFHRIDVDTILEHRHGSGMELYVTCRVCASNVSVDNAFGHVALAHREWLESTTVADMFITDPRLSSLPRWNSAADPDSDNTFSPIDNDETPGVAPDYHHQVLDVSERPLTSKFEVHSAKCEPSDDSLVDHQSLATFDLPSNHYLAEQIFTEQLVDTLCEIDSEPTSGPPKHGSLPDSMSSAPIETDIRCEVAMQCRRQATSATWPSGRERLFECDECDQRLVTRRSLTFHQCKHMGELLKKEVLPHECDNCGRRCATARDLQLHWKQHAVESSSARKLLFECDECGVTFSRGDHLQRHRSNHASEFAFACSNCERCFAESSKLTNHRRVHTAERPFACSDCDKCFARSDSLKKHRFVHTGDGPFACSDCDNCFARRGDLKRHRVVHTGERPFACTDCEKRFPDPSGLRRHRLTHTGERPYVCYDCGQRFNQIIHLKMHRFIHTGERPFACSDCGKCFARRSNLKVHRIVHTGERLFACSACGKRFVKRSDLKKHRVVHSGEMPFACTDCEKRFANSSSLRKHWLIHAGK